MRRRSPSWSEATSSGCGIGIDVGLVRRRCNDEAQLGAHAHVALAARQVANAEFGTLQVGQQRDGAAGGFLGFASGGDAGGVLGVIAMGEVDAKQIDAGAKQLLHL